MTMGQKPDDVAANLARVLNSHGHSFHYAVARRINELYSQRKSSLRVIAVEFPVTVSGRDYHIDIVLESNTARCYFAVECKRTDPAKSLWAFVKASAGQVAATDERAVFERLQRDMQGNVSKIFSEEHLSSPCFNLGVALSTGQRGDGQSGPASSAIDDAVTQSLRGVSGLANHFAEVAPRYTDRWAAPVLIPLVITTSTLWGSDTDIASADLLTGNLDPSALKATQLDFLWYFHNQSRSLRSPIVVASPDTKFRKWLRQHSTRTVGITSASGLDAMVNRNWEEWLTT